MKNNFKGGMSSTLTAFDVAKKWKISPIEFMPILEKGTEHEMEHTDDKDIARRIALDHIVGRLDYYDMLDKIENMKIGGDVNSEIEKIAKSVVFDLGEQYSENDYLGKCKEISEEIAKRLNQIDIKAIPMRIIDGEDKKYNSPVFNHAYTFIPMTNQIIDTQLWQVDGNPTDLNSRKVLFDFDDYNNFVELYEVEPIFDWENKFAKGGLIAPNTTFEKGGELRTENKIYEITRYYFGSSNASSMGGYFNIEGVSLRIKNHLANWNNFYEYHLKNIDENVNPYFLSIVIDSDNSYKDQDEADINTEEFVNDHIEENTNLKAEEIVFDSSDSIKDIIYIIDKKIKKMTSMAKGGKTISQTPAPASDRVSGSKTNPKGSASDTSLAKSIKFNDSLLKAIENKVKAHNEEFPSKKVTTPTAKAVVRRGMGAYSKSHRPFITGGAPNSRQAWGLARLNKFLLKKRGVKVKSAYIQDDDLL